MILVSFKDIPLSD